MQLSEREIIPLKQTYVLKLRDFILVLLVVGFWLLFHKVRVNKVLKLLLEFPQRSGICTQASDPQV